MIDKDTKEFVSWLEGAGKIRDDYFAANFPNNKYDPLTFQVNKKYIRIVSDGSVHCFIDRTNGDVLKAAGWKAPAKHARGNIFDDKNGLGSMGPFGTAYLK